MSENTSVAEVVSEATQELQPSEASESSQEATQEAPKEAAVADLSKKEQKELAKELKKKYQLKVDGSTEEVELDLSNDEEIKKHLQMSRAANRRMQEASYLKKAAEEFIELLKTNPKKVLRDPNINVDLKALAQEVIDEEIAAASKTPEQLEKEKLQSELEELKSKIKKDEEERRAAELERLQKEHEVKIESDIESALNTSNLPKTPYTVRKMADLLMLALQEDIDLSPKDLIPLLRNQMNSDIKELFTASSDDVLEELIGKDTISRIRKKNIAKMKQQVAETANSVKPTGATSEKKEEAPTKIPMKEFFKI